MFLLSMASILIAMTYICAFAMLNLDSTNVYLLKFMTTERCFNFNAIQCHVFS